MNKIIKKEVTRDAIVYNKGQLEKVAVRSFETIDMSFKESFWSPGMFLTSPSQFYNNNQLVLDYWQPNYQYLQSQIHGTVYSCMHKRASTVAQAFPLLKSKFSQLDGNMLPEDNAAVQLIDQPKGPNSDYTWSDFLEEWMLNRDAYGNVYVKIVRDKRRKHPVTHMGIPVELHILPIYTNSMMIPIYDKNKTLVAWDYNEGGGYGLGKETFSATDIIRFKVASLSNEFYGQSILTSLKNSLAIRTAIEQYQLNFFKYDCASKVIINVSGEEFDTSEEALDKFGEDFQAKYQGQPYKPVVIPDGTKVTQATFSPKESEFVESLNTLNTLIASGFDVPPSLLSFLKDVPYAAATAAKRDFITFTITGLLNEINNKISRFLQIEFDRSIYIEHLINNPPEEVSPKEKARIMGDYGLGTVNSILKVIGEGKAKLPDGKDDPKGYEWVSKKGSSVENKETDDNSGTDKDNK